MRPEMPSLLSDVVGAAERTIDRVTGDVRRIDGLEQLFERVTAACDWATDEPRRLCAEHTKLLVQQLRAIERKGPLSDPHETSWRATIVAALLPYVRADLSAALDVTANAGRGERAAS